MSQARDYVLDLGILNAIYHKKPVVMSNLKALPKDCRFHVSVITLGEIEYGQTSPTAHDIEKRAAFKQWFFGTYGAMLPVVEWDADWYAKLRRRLFYRFARTSKYPEEWQDRLGEKCRIDMNDLWLVAQAAARGFSLVTTDAMENLKQIVEPNEVRIITWQV